MSGDVVLLTSAGGDDLAAVVQCIERTAQVRLARDLDALERAALGPHTTLIGFGTGTIVPAPLLRLLARPAYNFHAASPDYPGRDPHHFAAYDGVRRYGATLHVMTERVDDGPILAVEWIDLPQQVSPSELLRLANAAMLKLLKARIADLVGSTPLTPLSGVVWGQRKTTRALFREMCRLSPTISRDEFERRFFAFDGAEYDNLTTNLHGWTFRIEKSVPRQVVDSRWQEFTEEGYRVLVQKAKAAGYAFVGFNERTPTRHVIWRHDIDHSIHRAARIAEIEREEGVASTFFVNPHSMLYNMLEPECTALLRRIVQIGHALGLHFDADAYPMPLSAAQFADALARERSLLRDFICVPIDAFSIHNPGIHGLTEIDEPEIAGMSNAFDREIRTQYGYVSDANGYWRQRPAAEVIECGGHERLQVLTHPDWWTPDALPPRARVERCVLGRAERVMAKYDDVLRRSGRRNITS